MMTPIDPNSLTVTQNTSEHRFEIAIGDAVAFVEYRLVGKSIIFTHTEVPPIFEGQGIGSRLVKGALEAAVEQGLRIEPQCPFVDAYIRRHPEYQPYTRGYQNDQG
jgi:predicted GNAT family acetyltransferase